MEIQDRLTKEEYLSIKEEDNIFLNRDYYTVTVGVRVGTINIPNKGHILTILPATTAYINKKDIINNMISRSRVRYLVTNKKPFPITHIYASGHICYGNLHIQPTLHITAIFEVLNTLLLHNDCVPHTDLSLVLNIHKQREINTIIHSHSIPLSVSVENILTSTWLWELGNTILETYGEDDAIRIMTDVFNIIFK